MSVIQQNAVKEILEKLPVNAGAFNGSEYPLPVAAAFLGNKPVSVPEIRSELIEKQNADVKDLLEPLLLAAELVEAGRPDREKFFLTDRTIQGMVFMGAKWMAGWALVLGGNAHRALIDELKKRYFMVFTDVPEIADTTYIGDRETSPVYFLQLMVRYGLVWGRIPPGDDHTMGHFLETDMPGFMVIAQDLPPLAYHIALGLMKLGCPAVVPPTFPFPYGNRIVAQGVNEIMDAAGRFPNLRQRYYKDEVINLPEFCNRAYSQETFKPAQRFGGTPDSFFCVRKVPAINNRMEIIGIPVKGLGVLVEVAHDNFSDDIAETVEKSAIKAVGFLSGVRGYNKKGSFHLELREGTELDPAQIAESIYWETRLQYPRIEKLSVRIICDEDQLTAQAPAIHDYQKKRSAFIDSMNEENTGEFCVCTECRPFSLGHTCILTPDRTPMCASRTYASVKAAALFGTPTTPFKRRTEEQIALRAVFDKGRVIDAERGEYEGANEMYKKLTNGRLTRVFLHSVRGFPHTSCGCFQTLVFWLEEVNGIGIMLRDSPATTPDGRTWSGLANSAGGRQCPGIMGVSVAYIRSPQFLRGDGGIQNVVWMDSELKKKVADIIPANRKIATERDVTTIDDLKKFLHDHSGY